MQEFPYSRFQPCVIISVTRKQEPEKELVIKNEIYRQYWSDKTPKVLVEVFFPK